jgi:hypothetical protein
MESVKSINPFKSKCLNHGLFGLKDYTGKKFKMVELKYKECLNHGLFGLKDYTGKKF